MQKECGTERAEARKRLAAQILTQLPDNRDEAIAVLAIVHQLVIWEASGDGILGPTLRIVGG